MDAPVEDEIPKEDQILPLLREIIGKADLDALTKKGCRKELEKRLGKSLDAHKAAISTWVDAILEELVVKSPEGEPISSQEEEEEEEKKKKPQAKVTKKRKKAPAKSNKAEEGEAAPPKKKRKRKQARSRGFSSLRELSMAVGQRRLLNGTASLGDPEAEALVAKRLKEAGFSWVGKFPTKSEIAELKEAHDLKSDLDGIEADNIVHGSRRRRMPAVRYRDMVLDGEDAGEEAELSSD